MLTSQHLRVIKNAGRDLPAQAALVTVSGIHEYYEPEQLVDPHTSLPAQSCISCWNAQNG